MQIFISYFYAFNKLATDWQRFNVSFCLVHGRVYVSLYAREYVGMFVNCNKMFFIDSLKGMIAKEKEDRRRRCVNGW